MSLVNMNQLKSLIKNGVSSEEEGKVFRALLLAVLSRGSRVDLHTDDSEVNAIQRVFTEYTGESVPQSEIRVASIMNSDAPMRPISKMAAKLPRELRLLVINALREIMYADGSIRSTEAEFFNDVAKALKVSYAEVAGLAVES